MYNGIINVAKEAGFTSFDVVAKLRGILGQKKIGHTGTLDPQATGVLPVCLGNGTKLVDMITDRSKEYRARVLLGVSTDTEDTTGNVIKKDEADFYKCNEEEFIGRIRTVTAEFIGGYFQVPPMYSAIKMDGKRLYELARAGAEVERKPRWVDIYEIEIESIDLPYFTMRVHCGKGTYIRSLCRDIGEKLGCQACMDKLVRTGVGVFKLEDSLTLSRIEQYKKDGTLDRYIINVDAMFEEYPQIDVPAEYEKLIKNGNKIPCFQKVSGEMLRVYFDNIFFGIYRVDADNNCFSPVKMFPPGGSD